MKIGMCMMRKSQFINIPYPRYIKIKILFAIVVAFGILVLNPTHRISFADCDTVYGLSISPTSGTTNTPITVSGMVNNCSNQSGISPTGLALFAPDPGNNNKPLSAIPLKTDGQGNISPTTFVFPHNGTWQLEVVYQLKSLPILAATNNDLVIITKGQPKVCGEQTTPNATDCPSNCPATLVSGSTWTCGGQAPEQHLPTGTTITLSIDPSTPLGSDTIYGDEEKATFTYTASTGIFTQGKTYYAYFYRDDDKPIRTISAPALSSTTIKFIFDTSAGQFGSDPALFASIYGNNAEYSFNYWATGIDNPYGAGHTTMFTTWANDVNLTDNFRYDPNGHGKWSIFFLDKLLDAPDYSKTDVVSSLLYQETKAFRGVNPNGQPYDNFWVINPLSFDPSTQPTKVGNQNGIIAGQSYTLDIHLPNPSLLPITAAPRNQTKYCLYTNEPYTFTPTNHYITASGTTSISMQFNSINATGNNGNPEFCLDQITWSGGNNSSNIDMCSLTGSLFDAKFLSSASCSFSTPGLIFVPAPTPTPTPTPPLPPCKEYAYLDPQGTPQPLHSNIDDAGNFAFDTPPADPALSGSPYPYRCAQVNTVFGNFGTDPTSFIKMVFSIILSLSGGIVLISIIYAGYRIMTSNGNPEVLKSARERMTSAIIGLLFIIFSFVLLQFIGVDILGIPGFGK